MTARRGGCGIQKMKRSDRICRSRGGLPLVLNRKTTPAALFSGCFAAFSYSRVHPSLRSCKEGTNASLAIILTSTSSGDLTLMFKEKLTGFVATLSKEKQSELCRAPDRIRPEVSDSKHVHRAQW